MRVTRIEISGDAEDGNGGEVPQPVIVVDQPQTTKATLRVGAGEEEGGDGEDEECEGTVPTLALQDMSAIPPDSAEVESLELGTFRSLPNCIFQVFHIFIF